MTPTHSVSYRHINKCISTLVLEQDSVRNYFRVTWMKNAVFKHLFYGGYELLSEPRLRKTFVQVLKAGLRVRVVNDQRQHLTQSTTFQEKQNIVVKYCVRKISIVDHCSRPIVTVEQSRGKKSIIIQSLFFERDTTNRRHNIIYSTMQKDALMLTILLHDVSQFSRKLRFH